MSLLKDLVKTLNEQEISFGGGAIGGTEGQPRVRRLDDEGTDPEATADVGPEADDGMGQDMGQEDSVAMDVPFLIRILEWAHSEADSDDEIHSVVENMIVASGEGRTLTMEDYDEIVGSSGGDGLGSEVVPGDGMGQGTEDESGYNDSGITPEIPNKVQ